MLTRVELPVRCIVLVLGAALLLTGAVFAALPQMARAAILPEQDEVIYLCQDEWSDDFDDRVTSVTAGNSNVKVYDWWGFSLCGKSSGSTTVTYTFDDDGTDVTRSFIVRVYSLGTRSLALYPGKKQSIRLDGASTSWSSSNSAVAKVTSKGVVTGKAAGCCTVQGKLGDTVLSVMVGVSSKKAYKAVKNAEHDATLHLKYSQDKRTAKSYRDCSSYVARCYWDKALKRKLVDFGDKDYPPTAAEQARWLNKKGLCVAKKAVPVSRLLPGDTVYFETDYAGKNSRYRSIDHAAIYVGGGLMLNTGGSLSDTITYRYYWEKDSSIRFIGRPAATLVMNKTECSLSTVGFKRSVRLRPLFKKGKKTKWTSSKPSVAKVSKKGVVTARSKGTCRIYAKVGGKKTSCLVTVG